MLLPLPHELLVRYIHVPRRGENPVFSTCLLERGMEKVQSLAKNCPAMYSECKLSIRFRGTDSVLCHPAGPVKFAPLLLEQSTLVSRYPTSDCRVRLASLALLQRASDVCSVDQPLLHVFIHSLVSSAGAQLYARSQFATFSSSTVPSSDCAPGKEY